MPRLAGPPELLQLHREMNRQLARQTEEWDSYDYGEGYYYQSSDELGITGLRDTTGRVEAFGLTRAREGPDRARDRMQHRLPDARRSRPRRRASSAFELNPYLIAIAQARRRVPRRRQRRVLGRGVRGLPTPTRRSTTCSRSRTITPTTATPASPRGVLRTLPRADEARRPSDLRVAPARDRGRALRRDREDHRALLRHRAQRGARVRHLPRQEPPLHRGLPPLGSGGHAKHYRRQTPGPRGRRRAGRPRVRLLELEGSSGTASTTTRPSNPTATTQPKATPTTVAGPDLAKLIPSSVPSGFTQVPDDVADTGPANITKAAQDDLDRNGAAILRQAGFLQGYQRTWTKPGGGGDDNILLLYQFATPEGASSTPTTGTNSSAPLPRAKP